jgi:hypothetical protein
MKNVMWVSVIGMLYLTRKAKDDISSLVSKIIIVLGGIAGTVSMILMYIYRH